MRRPGNRNTMHKSMSSPRRGFLFGFAAVLAAGGVAHAADSEDARIDGKIAEIFGHHVGVPPETLKPSDRFVEEMGVDDLDDLAAILTDIEAQFGIDIPVDIATQFTNMGNVMRFVKDVLASKRF